MRSFDAAPILRWEVFHISHHYNCRHLCCRVTHVGNICPDWRRAHPLVHVCPAAYFHLASNAISPSLAPMAQPASGEVRTSCGIFAGGICALEYRLAVVHAAAKSTKLHGITVVMDFGTSWLVAYFDGARSYHLHGADSGFVWRRVL